MEEKPELIAYTYYLLGGSASFYKNLFLNNPDDYFDIKGVILKYDWYGDQVPPVEEIRVNPKDEIVDVSFSRPIRSSRIIAGFSTIKKGLIVCSDTHELLAFKIFGKKNKSLYFICHDDSYLSSTKEYESLIDVIITHNKSIYEDVINLIPHRTDDIYYIPHGVKITEFKKIKNFDNVLNIVFLARNSKRKGLFDLLEIDDILISKGLKVSWTILGNGPERKKFIELSKNKKNFYFDIPPSFSDLNLILEKQDIFILPSRVDGLPVSLLESMCMGCVPIVAEFNRGIREVVTEKTGFVLEIGDNIQFAEKIIQLNENRDLLSKMSSEAILMIKNNHDIKKQANKYFELFKEFDKKNKHHKSGIFEKLYIVKFIFKKALSRSLSGLYKLKNKYISKKPLLS